MAERFLRVQRDGNTLAEIQLNAGETARVEHSERSEARTTLRDEEELLVVLEVKAPAKRAARKPAAKKPAAKKSAKK